MVYLRCVCRQVLLPQQQLRAPQLLAEGLAVFGGGGDLGDGDAARAGIARQVRHDLHMQMAQITKMSRLTCDTMPHLRDGEVAGADVACQVHHAQRAGEVFKGGGPVDEVVQQLRRGPEGDSR